jgi:hypothetical protein
MNKVFIILLFLLVRISFGQGLSTQTLINKIDVGYSTRWDMEQILGKGDFLNEKLLDPHYEHNLGKEDTRPYNGLLYQKLGIIFKCAEDGERISGIHFLSPYKGDFGFDRKIEIGKTPLIDAFPRIDTFKVTTTGSSKYYAFSYKEFRFYIEKPNDHKNKKHWSDVPSFKENLAYYANQPISKVTVSLYDYEKFDLGKINKEDNVFCERPIYAPISESHLNCYKLVWPNQLSLLEIPFYALTGGAKSEIERIGYWKEYSPDHKLIYEGNYKKGKRTYSKRQIKSNK